MQLLANFFKFVINIGRHAAWEMKAGLIVFLVKNEVHGRKPANVLVR